MKNGWKGVAAVFVAGVLSGTAVQVWGDKGGRFGGDPEERQERMLERLEDKLDLTGEQKTKVEAILKERHEKIKAIHEEVKPRLEKVRNDSDAAIKAVLTPEQQTKFDKMREKMKERMEGRKHKGDKKDKKDKKEERDDKDKD